MSPERIIMIAVGMVAMLIMTLLRKKTQFPQLAWWKIPVLMVILTVAGVAGTMILYFIETGEFGGTSFYGAVLFVPVLMLPALALKLNYHTVLDVCAGAECAMLTVMKLDCLSFGPEDPACCYGKQVELFGQSFQFPSQIVETLNSVFVGVVLILAFRKMRRGSQYPLYMLVYGATRFLWNLLRYPKPEDFILGIPQGNFWSIISMLIGAAWMAYLYKDELKKAMYSKPQKSKKRK